MKMAIIRLYEKETMNKVCIEIDTEECVKEIAETILKHSDCYEYASIYSPKDHFIQTIQKSQVV